MRFCVLLAMFLNLERFMMACLGTLLQQGLLFLLMNLVLKVHFDLVLILKCFLDFGSIYFTGFNSV